MTLEAATTPLRLGLVGRGIGHSLSPRLHAKAMELTGIAGNFTIFDCADEAAAITLFARLRAGELDGLSVTTPYKSLALQCADAWLRTAHHKAGVFTQPANTLFAQDGRLVAASTDGHGLGAALLGAQVNLVGKRVLLLGAGGAGQAVAAEVLALGAAQLRVANRAAAQAAALVDRLNTIWPKHAFAQTWGDARGLAGVDIVLHATRLGHGLDGSAASVAEVATHLEWLPWTAWANHAPLLADLVYAHALTPVQALAQARGLPLDARLAEPLVEVAHMHAERMEPKGVLVFFGQAMLAHQAARAFTLWTGQRVDSVRMLAAILPTQNAGI